MELKLRIFFGSSSSINWVWYPKIHKSQEIFWMISRISNERIFTRRGTFPTSKNDSLELL